MSGRNVRIAARFAQQVAHFAEQVPHFAQHVAHFRTFICSPYRLSYMTLRLVLRKTVAHFAPHQERLLFLTAPYVTSHCCSFSHIPAALWRRK
jgi:hypothetical protein